MSVALATMHREIDVSGTFVMSALHAKAAMLSWGRSACSRCKAGTDL